MCSRCFTALATIATGVAATGSSHPDVNSPTATCHDIKSAYQSSSCCGANLQTMTNFEVTPPPPPPMAGTNECAGQRPYYSGNPLGAGQNTTSFPDSPQGYFYNTNCTLEGGVANAFEQSGTNVTVGYSGSGIVGVTFSGASPISTPYWQAGLCPVNVHWHLGTEHLSVGQFDEHGVGPLSPYASGGHGHGRRLTGSGGVRQGFQCHHYDAMDPQYTTPYAWKYCEQMEVGQTYEIHWPHSAAGACGSPSQYQTPFYDGVFCRPGIVSLVPLTTFSTVGVQAQIFTIVNNESYYYPDLFRGMVVDGDMGQWSNIAYYTGSTTGTSRNNEICSRYTPITWQVDRTCHKISASSFDKLCKDMLVQRDDMQGDVYPHGARELVADAHAAPQNQGR